MAYYFKWQMREILGMTMRERRIWLSQIDRIHLEQKKARDKELSRQVEYLESLRAKEEN